MRGYGRLCGAGCVIVRSAVLGVLLAFAAISAYADEPASPTTIVVFGDSQAQGLAGGLQRVLVEDPRYRVLNRTHPGAALVHGESEWLAPIERFAAREKADIALVMFGANDRLDMRDEHGAYLHFRSDEWREAYAARANPRKGCERPVPALKGPNYRSTPLGLASFVRTALRRLKPAATQGRPLRGLAPQRSRL